MKPINNHSETHKNESQEASHSEKSSTELEISRILEENKGCEELKVQMDDDKILRYVTTEKIEVNDNANIERICRQYPNQDVLVKIRNGKKIVIERTKIVKP